MSSKINKSYSVLMTVYKQDTEEQFQQAFLSVIHQTFLPKEIILIADGPISTNLEKVILDYKQSVNNLIFHQLEYNIGLGNALNIGLNLASTNFIMRMDADDISTPDRAIKLMTAFTNDICIVGSYISEFELTKDERPVIIKYKHIVSSKEIKNYYRDPVGHATIMFKKDVVVSAGGYLDCLYFEDTYLWLRMAKNEHLKFKTVPEILYFARTGKNFYHRRGGWNYVKTEVKNFLRFYNEGLITKRSFLFNIIVRPPIRLLPKQILKQFYLKLLRVQH